MAQTRRYRLLCPIARALDRVGDRWTLLVLRDLHAGPARFSDLQTLPGIASNLLTNRLRQLEDDGLIRRRNAEYGTTVYELTDLGSRTGDLLFELARFGAELQPDEEVKRPGNLRTIAVTLRVACQRVVDPDLSLKAELVVDGEPFGFTVDRGIVDVKAGAVSNPEATLTTSYEPMIAVADGGLSLDDFASNWIQLSGPDPAQGRALAELMGRAMTQMNGAG
ncbi:MAG: helix-turn-helix transcriptional regulator [Myxococcales bacterium]|nr:helix-turn-helix transcriptional regulator [Myxococcales bacterium]